MALRNRFMQRRLWGDVVPLQNGDRVKVIGKHARGHQTRQAATDNNSVLTEAMFHHTAPSRRVRNRLQVFICGWGVHAWALITVSAT